MAASYVKERKRSVLPLKGLSPQAVSNQAILRGLIEKYRSNKEVRRVMWETGIPTWRWETLNADLTILREAKALGETLKFVGIGKFITERLYSEARVPMKTQFQTVFRAEGINKITGEWETRHITISHAEEAMRWELEQEAIIRLEGSPLYFEVYKITPIFGRVSPEWEVY